MKNRNKSDRFETFLAHATRVLVWGLLLAVVFLLRSFFLLIFLTFVFAYIQASGVNKLKPVIANRSARAVVVALGLLLVLLAIGAYLVPQFKQQAVIFVESYPRYTQTIDAELYKLSEYYPMLQSVLLPDEPTGLAQLADQATGSKYSPSAAIIQKLADADTETENNLGHYMAVVKNIGQSLLAIGSAFFLSLLFSFLIVLDLPKLTESVRSLERTRLQFVYEEVAGSIRDFGMTMGRALEAQLFIALLNMVLTGAGLLLMGLGKHLAFLSVVVFLCSFIPVAGAFISSAPICLVAFQESGLGLVLAGIALVCVVHTIEAYILNPRIYGHHMRMNPVLVLIILTIAGKMFNFWGLILGVPVCNYIFGHAIQRPERRESLK